MSKATLNPHKRGSSSPLTDHAFAGVVYTSPRDCDIFWRPYGKNSFFVKALHWILDVFVISTSSLPNSIGTASACWSSTQLYFKECLLTRRSEIAPAAATHGEIENMCSLSRSYYTRVLECSTGSSAMALLLYSARTRREASTFSNIFEQCS